MAFRPTLISDGQYGYGPPIIHRSVVTLGDQRNSSTGPEGGDVSFISHVIKTCKTGKRIEMQLLEPFGRMPLEARRAIRCMPQNIFGTPSPRRLVGRNVIKERQVNTRGPKRRGRLDDRMTRERGRGPNPNETTAPALQGITSHIPTVSKFLRQFASELRRRENSAVERRKRR